MAWRKINEFTGHTGIAKVYYSSDQEEFRITLTRNNVVRHEEDYFTTDVDDAVGTAKLMSSEKVEK